MKQLLSWKVMLLVVLALMNALALALGYPRVTAVDAAPSAQEGYPVNTITVSGFGQAHGAPDVAEVQLGVNVTNADVGAAVAQVNDTMSQVRAAILAAGVAEADLQTAGFNVWSEDRYDPQTGASTGERVYRAENMLQVTVRDIDNLEAVINAGLDAGATNIFGLTFGLDDASALEQQARAAALDNARARAAQIAAEVGVALGEAIIVNEAYGGGVPPMPYAAAQGMGGGGGGPVIEQGQLTVSVTVMVTFSMER